MLQPDLIQNLNLIAVEGWEYHKLPPETLTPSGGGTGRWSETSGGGKSPRSRHKKMLLPASHLVIGKAPH